MSYSVSSSDFIHSVLHVAGLRKAAVVTTKGLGPCIEGLVSRSPISCNWDLPRQTRTAISLPGQDQRIIHLFIIPGACRTWPSGTRPISQSGGSRAAPGGSSPCRAPTRTPPPSRGPSASSPPPSAAPRSAGSPAPPAEIGECALYRLYGTTLNSVTAPLKTH